MLGAIDTPWASTNFVEVCLPDTDTVTPAKEGIVPPTVHETLNTPENVYGMLFVCRKLLAVMVLEVVEEPMTVVLSFGSTSASVKNRVGATPVTMPATVTKSITSDVPYPLTIALPLAVMVAPFKAAGVWLFESKKTGNGLPGRTISAITHS